jgi:hypothetical protein
MPSFSERIRDLPETCAMRDGRKWKRVPQIVLTRHGQRYEAYDGLDVEFVIDVTEQMLLEGYGSPVTWHKIERIINQYQRRAMAEYERVGFMVTVDRGLYRVRRALRKNNSNESEFYFGGKDRRRFIVVPRPQNQKSPPLPLLHSHRNASSRSLPPPIIAMPATGLV